MWKFLLILLLFIIACNTCSNSNATTLAGECNVAPGYFWTKSTVQYPVQQCKYFNELQMLGQPQENHWDHWWGNTSWYMGHNTPLNGIGR